MPPSIPFTPARKPGRRERLKEAAFLAALSVACMLLTVWALQLWRADLGAPFANGGDSFVHGAFAESVAENGTYLRTPRLGAPTGADLSDFPQTDYLHMALIGLLSLVMPAYPNAINVYYLLTFPLAALFGAWALRRWGASRWASAAGGLLFAFAPYHLARGEGHLFLSAYFLVPVALVLAVEVAGETPPLFPGPGPASFFARHRLGALLACVLLALSNVYYAFFSAFFIAVAGFFGAIRHRSRRHLVSAGVMIGAIVLTSAIAVTPTLAYRLRSGPNPSGLVRNPGQAIVYGLKLDEMLLPADGHRVPALARLKATYHEGMRRVGRYMDNEAVSSSSLGVVASVGLLGLFGWLFYALARRGGPSSEGGLLERLALLAVAGFLLGSVGAFGSLVAFVLPQIRSYNRISIFLGFLALGAVALAVDAAGRRRGAWVAAGLAAGVLVVGMLDQTSPASVPDYAGIAARYRADDAFVRRVEGRLPKGVSVLQLPYMGYPEPGGDVVGMREYDPLVGYLHSRSLRWSYGAMKGRPTDLLLKRLSELPAPELVREARAQGFSAVWVDCAGFADGGAAVRQELSSLTSGTPLVSPDARYAVFRL